MFIYLQKGIEKS